MKRSGLSKATGGFFRATKNVEIESGSEDDEREKGTGKGNAEIEETPAEKKLRLAKEYISQLKGGAKEVDEQILEDKREAAGRLFRAAADEMQKFIDGGEFETRLAKNGHKKAPTVVVLAPDNIHIYSGGKDGSVFKWISHPLDHMRRVASTYGGRKEIEFAGHQSAVLALSVNTAGDVVASGDEKGKIILWDERLKKLHHFSEHKKAITGLAFRRMNSQLFSSSADRSVKVWDTESRSYIETLFGHQDAVQSVDANTRERVISAGGRDNTIRIFKVPEETQLIYRGHQGSIDCVALLSDEHFVSGGDDGAINYWTTARKKPICVVRNAHSGGWITALGAAINSDVFASGGVDGHVRLWRLTAEKSRIQQFHNLPLVGVINSLRISGDHRTICAAVAQENRLGRWNVQKNAKNAIWVLRLGKCSRESSESESSESESSEQSGSE